MGAHELVEQFIGSEVVAAVYVLARVEQRSSPVAAHLRPEGLKLGASKNEHQRKRYRERESFRHPNSLAYRFRLPPPLCTTRFRRQRNDKCGTHTDRAVHFDPAAMGFDDFFRNRQA